MPNTVLSIPLHAFTDLGRRQTARWKTLGVVAIVLLALVYRRRDELFLIFAWGVVLLKPLSMLVGERHAFHTVHVFSRDAQGALHVARQFCFRGRVLWQRVPDLRRYTGLRIFEPGDGTLCLELGNPQQQRYTLARLRPGGHGPGDISDIDAARRKLQALAERVSALTGLANRGTRAFG